MFGTFCKINIKDIFVFCNSYKLHNSYFINLAKIIFLLFLTATGRECLGGGRQVVFVAWRASGASKSRASRDAVPDASSQPEGAAD